MKAFRKDPEETLDYTVDHTKWLGTDDEIIERDWAVPTDLTLASVLFSDAKDTAFISGGTLGERYEVKLTVTTSFGRTEVTRFQLMIADT